VDFSYVHTSLKGGSLTLTLDRPKANAFDFQMIDELQGALRYAAAEESVRCVILTGSGGFFSTGQDLSVLADRLGEISIGDHLPGTYNQIVLQMRGLEKPILGAINGVAAGAGLGIALATDLRIAAEEAQFVFGFSRIGLAADTGVSLLLPRLVGLARATEMALTNRPLNAEEALDLGLVNRVVPAGQLANAAQELGEAFAKGPTRAFGLTKRAFNQAVLGGLEGALEREAELQDIAGSTEDHVEGVKAFLEKRDPDFRGR
jgi:2-(1,2-epoxy-1,2-dihydrophenyl)acetyl-CoA isomerase